MKSMTTSASTLYCEIKLEGGLVRGAVRELSYAGFFIETDAQLSPGHEVDIRLVDSAIREPVYLRVVVESCFAPGALNVRSQPGVQVRLMHYARDFGALLAGEVRSSSKTATQQPRNAVDRREGEREWLSDILEPNSGGSQQARSADPSRDWQKYEALAEPICTSLFPAHILPPEAIVIDDGELDDVIFILEELGVKTLRKTPADVSPENWVRPQSLLVVTAKRALQLRLPLQAEGQVFVSIAINDGDARTVCSAVRRIGYQVAISRPIHPRAMAMLFRQAIFPDHEQRANSREILGCSVQWWVPWKRKQEGVVLDISPGGCSLLTHAPIDCSTRIKIRVPEGVANGPSFTLSGEVVRTSREHEAMTFGVVFRELNVKAERRLQEVSMLPGPCILASEAFLPTPFDPEVGEYSHAAVESEHGREAPSDVSTKAPITTEIESEHGVPEVVAEEPQVERRQRRRAQLRQEVVALKEETSAIKHLLVSRDLTVDGMRVEAHPSLALDEEMQLVLYEDTESSPLILTARVARDDGREGWWLRFVNLDEQERERIVRALERFPPVARLDNSDSEPERVVLGQLLKNSDLEDLD
jgi:hypothetical protein